MRVGVISRGSPDYLIDIVTDGLIRLLGRSNVSLDYNVRGGIGGAYEHLLHRFVEPDAFGIHEAEVLVASVRSLPQAEAWMARTGRKAAIIDGEDDLVIREPWPARAAVYFKREYLAGIPYGPTIRPLPFAAIPEAFDHKDARPNPLFYLAGDTHPFRRQIVNVLVEMGFRPARNDFVKSEYNRILGVSMIGVSVRGLGWDTYRYWETPYFGAAMLSQRMPIVIPDNFKDGEEAVFFDDPEDFRTKAGRMLRDRDWTLGIARAGRKACLERHLSVNRAKTVLEALA